jgi:Bifunctional DNA primase/polymerase, N-terminal
MLPGPYYELTPAACERLRTDRADVARLGSRGAAGLIYANTFGIAVLRLRRGGRDPTIKHGVHGATTSPAQIRKWFATEKDSNVGGRTGGGWVVADLDVKNGDDGPGELLKFMAEHSVSLPPVPWVTSPTGGKHLWMRTDRELPSRSSSTRSIPGVDLLADGGHYVVLPPSVRIVRSDPDPVPGSTGGVHAVGYEWAPGCCLCQAPVIPEWLAEAMLTMPNISSSNGNGGGGGGGGPGGGSWAGAPELPPTEELLRTGLTPGSRSYDMKRLALRLWRQHGQDAVAEVTGICYRVWLATAQGDETFPWSEAKGRIAHARKFAAAQEATEARSMAGFLAYLERSMP